MAKPHSLVSEALSVTPPLAGAPKSALAPVFSAHRGESDEGYSRVLAVLNPRLRVIHAKDGLQWIMQIRKSPTRWESIAFCATRGGLILRIKEHWQQTFHREERELVPLETLVMLHCDPEAWGNIETLPAYYPK